ncbi:MAG: hypothetical protein JSV52_06420 [Candidatus Zixiibacteriota bacterium]|nr:MAG: hypothetical protein JSV52_06420 [candidate division Zixibacteria bacterium]
MRAPIKVTALLAVLVIASFSLATAQVDSCRVYVDLAEVTGLTAEGKIPLAGGDLVIPIYFLNLNRDGVNEVRTAISNGFYFDSPDGVTIGGVTLGKNCTYPFEMECAFMAGCYPFQGCYSWFDMYWGAAALTKGLGGLGIAGVSNEGDGLPAGFNNWLYSLNVASVAGAAEAQLVLDTTYWEPGNFWLWTAVGDSIAWDGPYVFQFEPGGCEDVAIATTAPAGPYLDGDAFTYDVDATGDAPITFALDPGAPAGMTIDPVSGLINWTCVKGTHPVTVRVSNDCPSEATEEFVIVVNKAPVITAIDDQTATEGAAFTYNVELDEVGYPIPPTFSIAGPAGMTIEPVTGVIDWTAAVGVHAVTVTATNTAGLSDDEDFTITVSGCDPYATCFPETTKLKALENERRLDVRIWCDDFEDIDWGTIRVFNIPPYSADHPQIEYFGDDSALVTDCFIMRFLGAGGMRPVPSDGYQDRPCPVYYDYKSGGDQTLTFLFNLTMYVGDVTFDGVTNIEDAVFMIDWLFNGGPRATLWGERMDECMDVDDSGRIDLLDVRAIIDIVMQ